MIPFTGIGLATAPWRSWKGCDLEVSWSLTPCQTVKDVPKPLPADTNYNLLGKWKNHVPRPTCIVAPTELRHHVSWLSLARCSDLSLFPFSMDRTRGVERIKKTVGVSAWSTEEPQKALTPSHNWCTSCVISFHSYCPGGRLDDMENAGTCSASLGYHRPFKHHMDFFQNGCWLQPLESLL